MSLFKQIVKQASIKQMEESAAAGATSAGAVAGFRAPLLKTRRRKMPKGVKFEQQEESKESTSDFFARVKKESEARRAKRDAEGGSRSSGRLRSRFAASRDRIGRSPARLFSLSSEQEEDNVDWNKEIEEFNKRRKESGDRGRSRLSKMRARRRDRNTPSPMSLGFEQEEDKVDWKKELEDFRKRDEKSTPRRRKSRLLGNRSRRMSGPTGSVFSLGNIRENDDDKQWFKDRGSWDRARNKIDCDDDDRTWSKCEGKLVAQWFANRNEGWVRGAKISESTGSSFKELVEYYRGILEQDGWETLELTIRSEQPRRLGDQIIAALRESPVRESLLSILNEAPGEEKFDPADVISKLRSAEEKADNEENTRGFALEDEDGNIVKVYVATEEAEEFEQALGAALAGEDEDDDEENTSLEIAEVLFNLKDRFTIVDVEWPEVEEDEEDMATDAGDLGDSEEDLDTDLEGEGGEGDELDVDIDAEGGEGDELDVDIDAEGGMDMDADVGAEGGNEMSALQAMIDLLKSQAEAQKAEAQAREAEANAEEAKYNAGAAEAKVKQEEEVLDMEAYYDKKTSADKEAKKLQKLAKWKHETAQESVSVADEEQEVFGALDGDEIPGNKFEEPGPDENRDHRMQPGEFIKYMLMNARRN